MSDDLASRLRSLHNLFAARVLDRESYEAAIERLRTQHGDADVDAALAALHTDVTASPPSPKRPARQGGAKSTRRKHNVTVESGAKAGVVIAGDQKGDIYLDGRRADEADLLIAKYLRQLAGRCSSLPLEALHQQRSHDDRHAIGLEAVFTQLTVEGSVSRESYEGNALKQLDLGAYLREHTGGSVLPWQRRTIAQSSRREQVSDLPEPAQLTMVSSQIELSRTADDEMRKFVQRAYIVIFVGPRLVTDAIAEDEHLVLLGEPGSGKSTALRYLALTLAKAGLDPSLDLARHLAGWDKLGEDDRLLPLFVPLLPFARQLAARPSMTGSADELWLHIVETLEPGGVRTGLAEAVRARLGQGRVLLMLDGLDEVVGADSRTKVVRAVTAFARDHERCRIVVSCRVRAYVGELNAAWQLPDWPTATLQPWDDSQQQHFVGAWYAAAVQAGSLPAAQRDSRIETLRRAIGASADLQRLSGSPLLLTVMGLVHLNDGRLPEDRVTLYGRCIDILLAQWEQRGKEHSAYGPLMQYIGLPERDIQLLMPLLTRAAYAAHQAASPNSPGSLGRETLRLMAMDHLKNQLGHPNPYDGAEKLLEYTDHRAGLLQASSAGDAYVFPHLTFQEYLAGLELTSGLGVVDRIMLHRVDDRWRIPILLGIGDHVSSRKLEMPFQLLSELLVAADRTEERRQRDLVFAGDIAADVGWDRLLQGGATFKDLQRRLAESLVPVVEGTVLPAAERVHAGVLLGALGDPRLGVCALPPPMVKVPGGSFVIGNTPDEYQQIIEQERANGLEQQAKEWYEDSVNKATVVVEPFELARFPVTNAQYKLFVDAYGYDATQAWWDAAGRAWLERERRQAPVYWEREGFGHSRPNHPVVTVTWYEATAFCRWLTQYLNDSFVYTLPSEAEWEYAARGSQRRIYPWGNEEPDAERTNFDGSYGGPTAVGCFIRGCTPETGIDDLAGSVCEWTRSEYRPNPYDPTDGREDASDGANKRFTFRGGGWGYTGQPPRVQPLPPRAG